ncbi:MAG: O-antigen ligase family protein, partial [Gammaproteobacteria bacterium]|nr:O-antigen ligase family protein [Gammaproteobacteria bacterium]
LMAWLSGDGTREFDRPSRFLLAVPALLLLIAYPPRLAALWGGLALGAIGAGGLALWQKLLLDTSRASGYTNVIQFGNLSMLLGILCLAGVGWAVLQPQRRRWIVLLCLGALMGIIGSLLSGSRGGWVGFPLMLLIFYRSYGKEWPLKWKAATVIAIVIAGTTVFAIPQAGVQGRVLEGVEDISSYVSGETENTSLGARFEMWKGASYLIADKPLLGWGENGYQEGMAALAERGIVSPVILQFDHAHNEFFNAFAKRGLIGLAVLLLLYLVPMKLFGEYLRHANLEVRSVALAGTLLPVAYVDFGLTQGFLSHNSGVMMYAFLLAVLWGVHSGHRRQFSYKA